MTDPTFRTTDPEKWGTGKGANLTPSEVDNSFWALLERIVELEDNPPAAVGISNITVTGTQMLVVLDDATTFGPFTLPTAVFHSRGDYEGGASYLELDLVSVPLQGLYMALQDIPEAPTSFDAGEENSEGPLWQLVFEDSGSGGGGGGGGSDPLNFFGNVINGYIPGSISKPYDHDSASFDSEDLDEDREVWAFEVLSSFQIDTPDFFGRASFEHPPAGGSGQLTMYVRPVDNSEGSHTPLFKFTWSPGDPFLSVESVASEPYVTQPGDRLSLRIDSTSAANNVTSRNLAFCFSVSPEGATP